MIRFSHSILSKICTLTCGVFFAGSLVFAAVTLPFQADFESPDYSAGTLVSDPDWSFDSALLTVEVTNTDFAFGTQSLLLTGSNVFTLTIDDQILTPVRWVDFYLKPAFVPVSGSPSAVIAMQAAETAFEQVASIGDVLVIDGDGAGSGTWMSTEVPIPLAGQTAQDWVRLTYRLDYANKQWDLYIDDKLVMIDLGFLEDSLTALDEFALIADAATATGFDYFYAGDVNPIFTDSDNDGMSDAYETANSLNSALDDRALDPDGDGLTNIEEFFLGSLAVVVDADVQYYADASLGDDTLYNGQSAYPGLPGALHGPKASLTAIVNSAPTGSRILIQSGSYNESILNPGGKDLILRPNGSVTIQ